MDQIMAYGSDPFAGLVNPARANARPMSSGGYPVLSYGAMQGGLRPRGYGSAAPDSYASAMGVGRSPSYTTPVRPNDAFDQYGRDTTVKGYTDTPPVRPFRPNDAFDQYGRDTTVKGYTDAPPTPVPPRPRPQRPMPPTRPRMPYREP